MAFGEDHMRPAISFSIIWMCRLASIVIALWWPARIYDPIYTPRHVRLTQQELHLRDGVIPQTTDDRAMAIFWMWEQRMMSFLRKRAWIRTSSGALLLMHR